MNTPRRSAAGSGSTDAPDRDLLLLGRAGAASEAMGAGGQRVTALTEDCRPRDEDGGPGQGVGSPVEVVGVLGDDEVSLVIDDLDVGEWR